MTIKFDKKIQMRWILFAVISLAIAGCSSSSDNTNANESDGGNGINESDSGNTINESDSGNTINESDSDNTINESDTDNQVDIRPITGPLLYSTGSIVTTIEQDFFTSNESISIAVETDEEEKTINNSIGPIDIPNLVYDDDGRVTDIETSPTSVPLSVAYNDDGTLDSIFSDRGDSTSTTNFIYENGRLVSRTFTDRPNGAPQTTSPLVDYQYDQNGTLLRATEYGSQDTNIKYEFILNDEGQIIEVLENVESPANFETRQVLTYDDAGNITQVEAYTPGGMLTTRTSITYVDSPGQVPNLVGFLLVLDPAFIPRFELE